VAGMNQAEKKIFEVTLAGLSLKLKTSHDAETVNQLVSYVNQKVTEALQMTKSGSIQNAALLASLNIAEELIILKQRAAAELEKIEGKAQKVLSDLESSRQQSMGLDH
jgi:cell division protein ZapA